VSVDRARIRVLAAHVIRTGGTTLLFLCAGFLIKVVLFSIMIICLGLFHSGSELFSSIDASGAGLVPLILNGLIAAPIVLFLILQTTALLPVLPIPAVVAGLVGFVVGFGTAQAEQLNARAMLSISVVGLIIGALLAFGRADALPIQSSPHSLQIFIELEICEGVAFVAAMMACWKFLDRLSSKTMTEESRLP
jgi:hypothetical protein